ncbi:DUF1330 domain-containing protein [Salipiger sp.]|uniref:DUF1330 domain-containing protein n=1 Tax=Salipiger sp. TaxID=2078585 RepID=UPI003A96DB7E
MTAYVIARVTVTDPEAYKAYAARTVASAATFGGVFRAKGGTQEILEGTAPERHVLIEFPSAGAARAWYDSAEYQQLRTIALAASTRDLVIVEGV